MWRAGWFLLCLGALSAPATARYLPPTSYELMGLADLIVMGTITAVYPNTFELRVDQALAGPLPAERLLVRRFDDWACAARWKRYAVGQKEVAFLQRVAPGTKKYGEGFWLMSAGSEGEWEILGDSIAIPATLASSYLPEEGLPHPGESLPLAEVADAIRRYSDCFSVQRGPGGWGLVQLKCDERALAAYRAKSPFHEFLAAGSIAASKPRTSSRSR